LSSEALDGALGMGAFRLRDAVAILETSGRAKAQHAIGGRFHISLRAEGRASTKPSEALGSRKPQPKFQSTGAERTLVLRQEILQRVYTLYLEQPGSYAIWDADRSEPERGARMREAEYLRDHGLVEGQIGADGGLALKLTSKGRDDLEQRDARARTSSLNQEP